MEVLFLLIAIYSAYLFSRIMNKRSKNLEIQKLKSIDLDSLNKSELEGLLKRTELTYKKVKQLQSVTIIQSELTKISSRVNSNISRFEESEQLDNFNNEIIIRKENNLDYSEFENQFELFKSQLKKKYYVLTQINASTAKFLFKRNIISENEFKIALSEIEKRDFNELKSKVKWLIKELKPI